MSRVNKQLSCPPPCGLAYSSSLLAALLALSLCASLSLQPVMLLAFLPACLPAPRWAQLDVDASWPEADRRVHKMVMNIGRRPTFEDAEPELR